jgi:hypothetical protein
MNPAKMNQAALKTTLELWALASSYERSSFFFVPGVPGFCTKRMRACCMIVAVSRCCAGITIVTGAGIRELNETGHG